MCKIDNMFGMVGNWKKIMWIFNLHAPYSAWQLAGLAMTGGRQLTESTWQMKWRILSKVFNFWQPTTDFIRWDKKNLLKFTTKKKRLSLSFSIGLRIVGIISLLIVLFVWHHHCILSKLNLPRWFPNQWQWTHWWGEIECKNSSCWMNRWSY